MSVQAYYSTDASAPVLTGEVGKVIDLLQACLVDGYGAKASRGWQMLAKTNNKAAFWSGDSTATQNVLWIDDNASDATPGARCARVRAYETLTTLDGSGDPSDGVGPYPDFTQMASGAWLLKSYSADTTAREWNLIADEASFYLFITENPGTVPNIISSCGHFFGDFHSFRTGDAYNCAMAFCGVIPTAFPTYPVTYSSFHQVAASPSTGHAGHYLCREFDGISPSIGFNKVGSGWSTNFGQNAGALYPNPVDNSLMLARILVGSSYVTSLYRGYMPGIYQPLHVRPVAHKGILSDLEGMPGRSLQFFSINAAAGTADSNQGRVCIDITGPWR